MTRDECKKLIMVIATSYPNFKPNNLSQVVDIWHMMLEGYDYNEIAMALKTYILTDTSGFAPSIGQLVGKARDIGTNELNEMEAWALVSKALRKASYYAEEEFNKLPPPVQKAVGSPSQLRNWSQTDIDSVENVIQSNFMRTYRTVMKRENEMSKLPTEFRQMLEQRNTIGIEGKSDERVCAEDEVM